MHIQKTVKGKRSVLSYTCSKKGRLLSLKADGCCQLAVVTVLLQCRDDWGNCLSELFPFPRLGRVTNTLMIKYTEAKYKYAIASSWYAIHIFPYF